MSNQEVPVCWALLCTVLLVHFIDGSIPPQQTHRVQSRIVAKTGGEVKILCPLASNSPMYFRWYKEKLEIDDSWERFEIGKQSLVIYEAIMDDAGLYICTGTNGFGKRQLNFTVIMVEDNNTTMTPEEILESQNPGEKPEFVHVDRMMPKNIEKTEGSVVKFRCKAHGKPRPKVTWFKDGEVIMDDYSGLFEFSKWTLTIMSVKMENSGHYMCKATNDAGSVNFTYTLSVIEKMPMKPIFITPHPMNSTVEIGASASFQCIVKSDVPPHIQWLKKVAAKDDLYATRHIANKTDGVIEVNKEKYVVLKSGEVLARKDGSYLNKLTINNVRSEHAGMYVCLGTNIIGFTFKQAFLSVTGDPSNESMDRQAGTTSDTSNDDLHLTLIICLPIAAAVTIIAVIVVLKQKCAKRPKRPPPPRHAPSAQSPADKDQFRSLHNFQQVPQPQPPAGQAQQSHPMINHYNQQDVHAHSELSSIPHRMYSPQQRVIYGDC